MFLFASAFTFGTNLHTVLLADECSMTEDAGAIFCLVEAQLEAVSAV